MATAQARAHTQRLMRAGEVARALGISHQWLIYLGDRGQIAYRRDLSGWRYYDRAEVERVKLEREERAAEARQQSA